ncbi:MAG: hypothetical protein ABSB49_04710 [Polyangia bacterium]
MDSIDHVERRARMRYEGARLRRALIGFAPVLVVVILAARFSQRPSSALGFGLAMFAMGIVLLWYGRDLKRAVLPGIAAGLLPLVLVLCANHVKHVCLGGTCMTLCVPACAVGGIVAGLATSSVGVRHKSRVAFWLAMSALALLTGAMGCSCIGHGGVVGLALGFGAGTVPGLLKGLFSGRSHARS